MAATRKLNWCVLNENEVIFRTVLHIPWRSLKAKEKGNSFVMSTGSLSYSYSTQTGPYDLVFVQLAPVVFRVAAILE